MNNAHAVKVGVIDAEQQGRHKIPTLRAMATLKFDNAESWISYSSALKIVKT